MKGNPFKLFGLVALVSWVLVYTVLFSLSDVWLPVLRFSSDQRWCTGAVCQAAFIYLFAGSIVGFLLMMLDKSIAVSQSEKLRVPEAVLLGVALAGGVAGIGIGMALFRHKTQKGKFQFFIGAILLLFMAMGFLVVRHA